MRLRSFTGRLLLCITLTAASILCVSISLRAEEPPGAERWEPAIRAFEEQDRKQPPAVGGVVFVGSSSIRLWKLDRAFPEIDALNRGFGGSEMSDAAHFADRIVLPYRPRLVVLYAGDNDLANGKTPCRIQADFQAFVAKVHAERPETRIVYLAIKPSISRWSLIHRVRAANALIQAECEENERLTFVDVAAPMLGEDGRPRAELFVEDGLHLSEQGYAIWEKLLEPHLGAAITE